MSNLGDLNFNANNVEPSAPMEALPPGKYKAVLAESERRANKNSRGNHLALTFQVIEGPFKNRKLWANLNISNPNEVAEKIAKAELSALCRAVGVLTPKDTSELHNIPLILTVKTRNQDGEVRNDIKGFEPATGTALPPGVPAPKTTAAPAGAPAKAPWIK